VLDLTGMSFSDGNVRAGIGGRYVERLWTSPRLAVDGTLGIAGTRNSADANRPYFNPAQDALASYGMAIVNPIYRRYEFVYDHRLVATPGIYWQQGFGTAPAFNLLYEHRVRANDVFEAGLGFSYGRQPYDGNPETSMAVLFNTRIRF
jgi:biofilm PGA synthesis protein PgaA